MSDKFSEAKGDGSPRSKNRASREALVLDAP